MILLITPSQRAPECATELKRNTGEDVVVAECLRRSVTLLRSEDYTIAVLDQYLLETEADQVDAAMQHLNTAVPLQVNFGISGTDRIVREVRAALSRRKREQRAARNAAASLLQSEIGSTVTALLLQCELALETPSLPSTAAEKLRSAHDLA